MITTDKNQSQYYSHNHHDQNSRDKNICSTHRRLILLDAQKFSDSLISLCLLSVRYSHPLHIHRLGRVCLRHLGEAGLPVNQIRFVLQIRWTTDYRYPLHNNRTNSRNSQNDSIRNECSLPQPSGVQIHDRAVRLY